MGLHTTGPAVKNHISSGMARKLLQYIKLCAVCGSWIISEFFLVYIFIYSIIFFTKNAKIETPVSERSGGTNGELRWNPLQECTETVGESEEVQRDISHELPDWQQEFRYNFADESTSTEPGRNPKQGSRDTSKSSLDLPMKPRAAVELGSGPHSVCAHFPKGPMCGICLKTKITRASCWYSRGQSGKFCWLDNCGSQNSQWRKWIAKQSSSCRGGARFSNTVDTIIPV